MIKEYTLENKVKHLEQSLYYHKESVKGEKLVSGLLGFLVGFISAALLLLFI